MSKKHYHKKYLPLIIGTSIAMGLFINFFINGNPSRFSANNTTQLKINQLLNYIENDYVDEVNTDSMVTTMVNQMLDNLDPHSTYISKEEYGSIRENMKGEIVGIGISFYKVEDSIAVIQSLPNGPSKKAGILPGDRILFANGIKLHDQNLSNDSIIKVLKGKMNTDVSLKVKRKGKEELLDFNLSRDRIPIQSVNAGIVLNQNLGYIKINRFAETTYQEFIEKLNQLKRQGTKNLVLDLRDNGGGFLKEAIAIADEFLQDGTPILYTKNRSGKTKENFATRKSSFKNGQLYILLNENSASASEIVAGAIQDNDRGYIVGRRSYGKGLVQREMKLADGSAVRLTVARYYTPTGRSIQRPYSNGNSSYFNDYEKRYENGELLERDSIQVNDSLKFTTPGGRIVYGGGGIVPDIFIPKKVNNLDEDLEYMLKGGVIDRFVFDELDKDRKFYNNLTEEDYSNFEIPKEMLLNYTEYLNQLAFNYNFETHEDKLKRFLKASIAKQLFGEEAAYRILTKSDPMLEAVQKHLNESS
ncbi:S41 family peptidase [Psychroflexus planctonicus]|uniref:Peptidase S41 n=1 Tax=Psychroflexus planctonicus TaxID=1526575 RepID=A0ABQ1SF41_9FLAO|nr:S41 family peptidase [Psychroflexus planctonicus]GGE25601.1 peptidase S41 [Psychroflexus planctonicus]